MENKTYLIKRNYKFTSSTIHCSIRGHSCIINTMLTWSTKNLELHVFKVPLCNLIHFSLFQHVDGIFI